MAHLHHLLNLRNYSTSVVLQWLVGALVGLTFPAWSWSATQPMALTDIDNGGISLTHHFGSLEDPGHNLTLAQVQAADAAGQFQTHAPAGAISFGYTRSAYWLRLHLRNDSVQPATRFLQIAYPGIGDLQLFQVNAAGTIHHTATGSLKPFASRGYDSRFFVLPLTVDPRSDLAVYVRAQSPGPIAIPAKLWTPEAFHHHERADYAAQSWYFGMAAAMIAFNLLLFIALRDSTYFLYVIFASCLVMALAVQEGLAKQLLLQESSSWAFGSANNL